VLCDQADDSLIFRSSSKRTPQQHLGRVPASGRCRSVLLGYSGQYAAADIWRPGHLDRHPRPDHRDPWYECAIAAAAGSVIGAYITFRLAGRAGRAYLDSKFGQRRVPKLLKFFDRWGTGALVASAAIPFPLPTSVFFVAAGASSRYSKQKYLTIVATSRAARYSAVAIVGERYGRHVIRVLRHPIQYWGWFLLVSAIFVALIVGGILINRRVAEATP
jgi:membrane protein YqaA with SNARE-associated domain